VIRSLTIVRIVESQQRFQELTAFLRSIGFEAGREWSDRHSTGAPNLAPLGNLELVEGKPPAEPEILVEVSDLDSVHRAARAQFGADAGDIAATHWKSRIFTLRLEGREAGFWAFDDPGQSSVDVREAAGDLDAHGMRFGVVVSRWNSFITERMLAGALDALRRCGAVTADIEVVRVPGAFEIPVAARALAEAGKVDAVITLGCLIRGETTHYEHIATEVTRGIGQSAQETGVPHSYGVLTVESLEQAIDRAGLKQGNKGFEAALAAIEMVSLQRKIRNP
jgi:6,7-dimethyl-8-ribityllumazine synthase